MKYIDEFNNYELSNKLLKEIDKRATRPFNIMEVCGTHTSAIYKNGIDQLLPSKIKLISGPGCPVCVTPDSYIDNAIELSKREDVIIATFGDMIKVPGSSSSLIKERAKGRDIRIIYSPLDCLKLAKENSNKQVVFLAIGFETTAPSIALAIKIAKEQQIYNFSILHSLKTMPKAMESLILDQDVQIDGFICPGHVATIIGMDDFDNLSKKYKAPMVISGFQCADILASILLIIDMLDNNRYWCENLYGRLVKTRGNHRARKLLEEVFITSSSLWRGFGEIKETGYKLNREYEAFDAYSKFSLNIKEQGIKERSIKKGCICADVLKGKKNPKQCEMFGVVCTPNNPIGPCMVSTEGACGIIYKFSGR